MSTSHILQDLLRGTGAHVDPLAAVGELDPAMAGRRLDGAPQTIWQLIVHMNYWMDYELRSIEGPEAIYPEHATASWPEKDGPENDAELQREVKRFEAQVGRLAAWATRLKEAKVRTRRVHPAKDETVEDVLWQMVSHNSYHTGQLVLLRRAFGAWPPPGGGDTW
jgi:uncharacterized damage-inducible protein DinB